MTAAKAISLYQPWASAIANGAKLIETRGTPMPRTLVGRRVAIQASVRRSKADAECFEEILDECWESRALFADQLDNVYDVLPFGAVICTAVFIGSVPTHEALASPMERRWGDYTAGRFAWLMGDVVRLREPVPMKFHQGVNNIELPAWALRGHTSEQMAQF